MVGRMKKILLLITSGLLTAIFSGCGHTPVRETTLMAVPPLKASAGAAAQRAGNFKRIIAPLAVKGITVYPAAFAGKLENSDVINTILQYGFNRVYCHLTSEQELNEDLQNFIVLASAKNLPVELVFSQRDFYRRYYGNRLIRNILIQYPDLFEAVTEAVKFNAELPENIRISGITVILSPHLFNSSNVARIRGHLYHWGKERYGIGQDNDMLMRESLEYAKKIAKIPGLPELTIAVPDFFHEAAEEKKLSVGRIGDFAAIAKRTAVISSANLPSKIPASVENELRSMPKKQQMLTVIRLAGHTSMDSGRLRRRNWRDFQNSVNYTIKKLSSQPGFGGIIISPLAVVEYLRQEK